MSKHTVLLHSFPLVAPPDYADKGKSLVLEVSLSYDIGGANYFSGTSSPRGYVLHCTPVTLEKSDGVSWRSAVLFHGLKRFVEPAKVFSARKLDALAANFRLMTDDPTSIVGELVSATLARESLTRQPESVG